MRLRSSAGLVAGAVLAALLTSCGGSNQPSTTSSRTRSTGSTPTATPSASSGAVTAGAACRTRLGGTVAFTDRARGLTLRVRTGRPQIVDHALASYAHGPANGHFLVTAVTVTNLGSTGVLVDPTAFVLTTAAGRRLTVDSGNAPTSGASHVLDQTFLMSRGSDQGPLIYDVPDVHGHIAYTAAGRGECTWTF